MKYILKKEELLNDRNIYFKIKQSVSKGKNHTVRKGVNDDKKNSFRSLYK